MAPPRPVTLRDLLELACDSSSDGFRCYPRRLARDEGGPSPPQLQPPPPPARPVLAEAAAGYHHLRRSPSRSPSSSSASLFSLPRISSLSRTFSRRIKEGFWRRRFDDDGDDEEAYLDDRDSCGFPSPLVSSCSSASSDSDESESEPDDHAGAEDSNKPASAPASECDDKASSSFSFSSPADHEDGCTDDDAAAAAGDKMQTQAVAEGDSSMAVGRKLGTMEDKQQQLSPVSVLDFLPFDDDEGSDAGTCSPAFLRRPIPDLLLQISRTKQQAQRKVGRYDPVEDLDARFATAASESGDSVGASTRLATSSSTSTTDSSGSGATATTAPRHADEEEHQSVGHQHPSPCQEPDGDDECRLLARLLQEGFAERLVDDEVARALVLDFFAEGVADADRRLRSVSRRRRVADEEEALVRAAAEWLRGAGPRWGVADVVLSGKAALADMERGRRWMCVVGQEEERDVGEAVEAMVADTLVEELVAELLVPCC